MGNRSAIRVLCLGLWASSLGFAANPSDPQAFSSGGCDDPLKVQSTPMQVIGLARSSLDKTSPLHQREVALQSLMSLRSSLTGPIFETGEAATKEVWRRKVLEGEIFDVLLDHFPKLCLLEGMPTTSEIVARISDYHIYHLLNVYERLAENPDDSSVAESAQDRYRMRLLLDRLLLDIGKSRGWKEMNLDGPSSDLGSNWYVKFYDRRNFSRPLLPRRSSRSTTQVLPAITALIENKAALAARVSSSNPIPHFPNVGQALENLDREVEREINQRIPQLFKFQWENSSFSSFTTQAQEQWSEILKIRLESARIEEGSLEEKEQWVFRSEYFLKMAHWSLSDTTKALVPRLEAIVRAHFPETWDEHSLLVALRANPKNHFAALTWFWNVAPGDAANRALAIDAFEVAGPILRMILANKHLVKRLENEWNPNFASRGESHFYLIQADLKKHFRDPTLGIRGILLALEIIMPRNSRTAAVLRGLQQK